MSSPTPPPAKDRKELSTEVRMLLASPPRIREKLDQLYGASRREGSVKDILTGMEEFDVTEVTDEVDELDAEGLDPGQEVVAESPRDDEGHVGSDAQHVTCGRKEAHTIDGPHLEKPRIRSDALLPGQPLCVGQAIGRPRRFNGW